MISIVKAIVIKIPFLVFLFSKKRAQNLLI
jgi:hypothetical protein